MKVLVYDAYASRDKKTTTYLDVLVEQGIPDYKTYSCRREYLTTNTNLHPIATKKYFLCHIEIASQNVEAWIHKKEYFIIEMENSH